MAWDGEGGVFPAAQGGVDGVAQAQQDGFGVFLNGVINRCHTEGLSVFTGCEDKVASGGGEIIWGGGGPGGDGVGDRHGGA